MKKVLIQTVVSRTPSKGTNAGIPMYIINDEFWSRDEPKPTDTHVVLKEVAGEGVHEGKTFTNVTGFANDSRMSVDSKIKLLSDNPEIANAIATLLR